MRRRRVILLVDNDPNSLSALAFTLYVRGFKIELASNAAEAYETFCDTHIDLVISQGWLPRGTSGFDLAKQMKALAPLVPVMLLVEKGNLDAMSHANALVWRKARTESLLQHIKILTARKRGPKKGFRAEKPPEGKGPGLRELGTFVERRAPRETGAHNPRSAA